MEKYTIIHDDCIGYAVFVMVNCGSPFWQQVSRWYLYRKCAENYARKLIKENINGNKTQAR